MHMQALIGLGAVELVVPGMLLIGCFPVYLTLYPSSNKSDHDEIGCLKSFNNLSSYHNELLKKAVSDLRSKHAGVRIMYADFYAQVADMVRSPEVFGTCICLCSFLFPDTCMHGRADGVVGFALMCTRTCRAGVRAESVLRRRRREPLQLQQWRELRHGRRKRLRQGSPYRW
jgi:hypothetical protein